ncbi:hypothetical protein MKQ70_25125 [Chitinophaga sedimenti]|uniref:hypothetical protein n=1 Tax=Chitinophaga sedimenti TaxID=2033606 RepID=UPI002002ABED|nr:hypothetical protein [Chitinophaga sedimenti]MCK7558109.1 hypothetical protein [Chitinophaga sedimenti]
MSKVVFLSIFPNAENIKDGYVRRVEDIEAVFRNEPRLHLEVSFTKNLKRRTQQVDPLLEVIYCNAFLHFFLILRILRSAKFIYSHSIIRLLKVWPQFILMGRQYRLVIDVHGAVPEEFAMRGQRMSSRLYGWLEYYFFHRSRLLIHVTDAMKKFYESKYPSLTSENVVYYIVNQPGTGVTNEGEELLRSQLRIQEGDVVIMYSGNCQVWQNVDLMLQLISSQRRENYKYIILTGEPAAFRAKLDKYGLDEAMVTVLSVTPKELPAYYTLAHYGFILRDNSAVNIVANPTKLGEYRNME